MQRMLDFGANARLGLFGRFIGPAKIRCVAAAYVCRAACAVLHHSECLMLVPLPGALKTSMAESDLLMLRDAVLQSARHKPTGSGISLPLNAYG